MSSDFIDGKEAFAAWQDLKVACDAIVEAAREAGIEFDAAGGLTLGADALAVGIAAVSNKKWFIVRKRQKGRGTGRRIEGLQIGRGDRVLLVEDVVTTGGSVLDALDAIRRTGAEVVAAVTLADRGDTARHAFDRLGVPYFPMATYADLGIDPVVPPANVLPMADAAIS
ncbi:MAG: orotate phosphoribosyltransferase [Acidimicrobiia bacterium]|nr:orotate phosphoribosyltransferase [Acidimicrobiia bacterium]MYC86355.1 orotate phosphoribosyltransferase [Acidimicrobiia bacterium]